MAGDKLFRKPSLDVVQGDTRGPMFAKIVTATYCYPGCRVITDTYDGSVSVGATDPSANLGILGYETTPLLYKPATRDTLYVAGDHVAVHNKPGMRFRGHLVPGTGTVVPGSKLVGCDASGNFQVITSSLTAVQQQHSIARSLEMVTNTSSVSDPVVCWMEWL